MRINKTTIEYIKGLVKAKAQPKLDALNASLEDAKKKDAALCKEYRAEVLKVQEKAIAEVKKIARKFKIDLCHYFDWRHELAERDPSADFDEFMGENASTPTKNEIIRIEDAIDELGKTIEKKCTEVIARLSLGGTAADLDRLIAELKF